MAGTVRSSRVVRMTALFAVFGAVVAIGAAAERGAANDGPSTVPEAAPIAEPSPTPAVTTTPEADPLPAPASSPGASPAAGPAPDPTPDAFSAAGTRAARITDATSTWASFTLLDRRTGERVGDARSAEVTNTESTVKVWLAADLLATRAAQGRALTAYETMRMTSMIRLSDDNAAEVIWRWMGSDASIRKMIATCRLTDTRVSPEWCSLTQIASRDLAGLGNCIVPGTGKFLSLEVGAPLLALMRSVEESDAFGIQQAYPAGAGVRIAVKNGWTEHGGTGLWNVDCLGIWGPGDRWVLAVTTRFPIERGLDYGAAVCRRVTGAIIPATRG